MQHAFRRLPGILLLLGVTATRAQAQAQVIGEAAWQGGLAQGGGGGLPASFLVGGSLAFVRGSFSLGPEVQFTTGRNRRLVAWGGVARFSFGRRWVRPYLVGAVGSYNWKRPNAVTVGVFSGSAGAGAVLGPPGTPLAFQAELRLHGSLQNIGTPGSLELFSATAGIRFHW